MIAAITQVEMIRKILRARHARGLQRQRIKGALAYPQWPGTGLQRGGVAVAFLALQMVVTLGLGDLLCSAYRPAVEVHQAPIWRGMGQDHAAAAPIAGIIQALAIQHDASLRG